jgi:hypothetical protein
VVVFDEPADKIIEIARDEGIVISRRELSEWHRCRLIRKPRQLHLGQGKGSGTIYPRGTARQAITCAVLMAHLRSKRKVGWELWVRGYPVAERYWRAPFKRALKAFRFLSSYFADSADPTDGVPALSDQADEFFSEVALCPKAPKGWGIARRRLGQKRFEDLLAIILSTAIGSFEVSEDGASGPASPTRILARLLGVEAGHHMRRIPLSPILEVTGEAVVENLAAMAKVLPQISRSVSMARLSETVLSEVRDELVFLRKFYLSVRESEGRNEPRSAPDVPFVRQAFGNLSLDGQAAAILLWWASRKVPGWRERLHELRQAVVLAVEQTKSGRGEYAKS